MGQLAAGGDPSRVPVLDGIRGLAILMVLLCHFSLFGGVEPEALADWIYLKLTLPLGCGVDLFFVLSGFLITGILLDTREGPRYFRSFYMRRVLRILPLYYGTLLFFYQVLPRIMPPGEAYQNVLKDQMWDWAYLSNVRLGLHGWPDVQYLSHFWSLGIEEQFYLIWPLLVLLVSRRRFQLLCVGLLLLGITARWGFWLQGNEAVRDYLTYTRLDGLVTGALLATFARGARGLAPLRPWAWAAGGITLVVLTHLMTSGAEGDARHFVGRLFLQTLFAVFFGSLLVLTVTAPAGSLLRKVFASRPLVFLGIYSYGLYVFHQPLLVYASTHGFGAFLFPVVFGSRLPALAVVALAGGALSVAVAMLSYHLYEQRFLRLKRFFKPGRTPSVVPRTAPASAGEVGKEAE